MEKESKDNILNIQMAWMKAIDRVAEALSRRYMTDINDPMREGHTGQVVAIETIIAFRCLLVDYGECHVRSDVDRWRDEHEQDLKNRDDGLDRMIWYRNWFDYMIKTLNKYGLLFETMPKGYSNVEMKSID